MKKKKIGFGQFCGNRDLRPGYKKPSRAGDRMASHSPKDFFLSFKPRNLARHSLPEKSEFKEGTSGWGVLLSGLLDHSRVHVFKKPDRRNQDRSS
ncbi:hypothetical protein SRHO_G00031030 [Serrasalmus rhombeus]